MLNNRIIIETMAHLFSILGYAEFEPRDLPVEDGFEIIQVPDYPEYIKCLRNPDDHKATEAYYVTPTGTYRIGPFLVLLLDNNHIQFKDYKLTVKQHYHRQDDETNTVSTVINCGQINLASLMNLIATPYISHFESSPKLGVWYRSSEHYKNTYLVDYHLNIVLDIHYHSEMTDGSHIQSKIGDFLEKCENTNANLIHLLNGDFE